MVTIEDAKSLSQLLYVDETVVSPERLLVGMKVEMEHGCVDSGTNVTQNDLIATAKIALAHFKENPGSESYKDYYHYLEEMEKKADKYWEGKHKPDIFINRGKAAFNYPASSINKSDCYDQSVSLWDLIYKIEK